MKAAETTNKNQHGLTFMDEVQEQPAALKQFIDQAFEEKDLQYALKEILAKKKNPYIVLTGMGSSLFACYITMKFLQHKGIRAYTAESLELHNMESSFFTEDMIIVAVSQSGESPEVIELIEQLREHTPNIPVIGVVNYPKSHLYNMADIAFRIYAGTEYFTSTKTYTNTLAAMILLAYQIAGCSKEECEELRSQMNQCVTKMAQMIMPGSQERGSQSNGRQSVEGQSLESQSNESQSVEGQNNESQIAESPKAPLIGKEIGDFIEDIDFLICVGSGYSYTTASHSEVVAEEAGKFYASRFTPAQFIHGPIELINPGFGVLLYDFDAKYHQKCDDVRENVLRYGGKVLMITNRTDVEKRENQMVCVIDHEDPLTATLLEVIPLELGIDSLCKKRGLATGSLSRVVKRMAK